MLRRFLDQFVRSVRDARGPATHSLHGFRVVVDNTRPDIDTGAVLRRLGDALELIERYQPWRFRHLQRDLREIRVIRFPCRGAYLMGEGVCITELTFLARTDITAATVASSIVHEGMHARVDRMGVAPESRDAAREERICRQAELGFGRALPTALGAPVIERAMASLALSDDDVAPGVDWDEARLRQNALDELARRTARS